MKGMGLIKLKDPHRFCEWVAAHQGRVSFLMDMMFTMCRHYPDTELIFYLDENDDNVIIVEPCGMEPYRFRLSEYRAIEDMLQPYQDSTSYRDFIRIYRDWCNQFRAWWHSYRDYILSSERSDSKDYCTLDSA
jgi:hypothetical protein